MHGNIYNWWIGIYVWYADVFNDMLEVCHEFHIKICDYYTRVPSKLDKIDTQPLYGFSSVKFDNSNGRIRFILEKKISSLKLIMHTLSVMTKMTSEMWISMIEHT